MALERKSYATEELLTSETAVALYVTCKEVSDRALALLLLLLLSPLFLVIGALVKLTSKGPIIYAQTRVGWYGKTFVIYKIRSMSHDCERNSGAQWSHPNDPRVTPIGRGLRATHLDELPQLWNVLRGDMSLVGPRPERPEFVSSFEQNLPHYRQRHVVRPGLTGLAQVQLPPDSDLESVRRKLALDLLYIRELSFGLDLKLLACTGCSLAGIPFSVSRRCLRVPDLTAAESAYARLASEFEPIARMQTA
jgi:lipopolysaccharide/colanic/teichoic acid biosynthesis glycosyltransferase